MKEPYVSLREASQLVSATKQSIFDKGLPRQLECFECFLAMTEGG